MDGTNAAQDGDFALFDQKGERILLAATEDTTMLVLNGQPIDEPVVAHGPFVMNTPQEIRQAIEDYQSGRMGHLASTA